MYEHEKRVMSAQTLTEHVVNDLADEEWKVRELRAIGRIMDL
jgi:hypothetical protein